MRVTPARVLLAVMTAALLTALVVLPSADLFALHNRVCLALLKVSGIPVGDVRIVDLFPGLGSAPVPATFVINVNASPGRVAILFGAGMLLLLLIHRRLALARGFLGFLITLLLVTAVVLTFHPSSQFGSVDFAQMWLRGAVLVWLLLPWFAAGMFMLIYPAKLMAVAWAVLVEGLAFLWSSVRLAFCVGVMHYSGILFIPVLWFVLGMLTDVIYLMVAYSIAVHWIARRSWGRRAT